MKRIVKVLIAGFLILVVCTIPKGVVHAAPSGVCPSVGQDTDCGILITITTAGATISVTGQGPYDGVEDTLVGVINKSSRPISSLGLKSALNIFGFDGDGIDTYGIPGNPLDSSGYGGPNAYFTTNNSSLTTGTVNFITPIAANTGTGYFSLEEQVGNVSCQDVVNNSVNFTVSGKTGENINATFTPKLNGVNISLQQAEQYCGFVNFDWVQFKTHQDDPSPFYARNLGGAFDASVNGPVHLTSKRSPRSDPPQGGGYTYTAQPDFSYPFYYNASSNTTPKDEVLNHEIGGYTLTFHDAPSNPCLPGGAGTGTPLCQNTTEPPGSYGGFETHLAGVNADGTPTDLIIGKTWTTKYNGTTGGVAIDKTDLLGDDNGTGGITITDGQDVTNYQYNGVAVTTVNGAPLGGPAPSTLVYTGPTVIANTLPVTLSARLTTTGATPIPSEPVTLTLGTGSTAQSCTGTTDATGAASCGLTVSQPLGPGTVTASFAGDTSYLPSSTSVNTVVFAYSSGGAFVVGDKSVGPLTSAAGKPVTFWGAQWAKANSLSSGSAPNSFKGFENSVLLPICGTAWTTSTANSSNPPPSISSYTAVIVSSSISQSGSTISGNTSHVVIVKVDPGYASDPGHTGTGTVVAILC